MGALINFSMKQEDGTYKYFTASINNELDKFGNNVSITIAQTKEQREAKEKKTYVGNGKVVWTDGNIEVAKSVDKTNLPF